MQWHPLFAKLLRPLLEGYYDIQVNVEVGDVPREADLVVIRRTAPGALPFRGLWKHLLAWNVLEYKGPSVFARLDDLDLLVELGLGIHRRLREKRNAPRPIAAEDVAFWYLAHRLGARFLIGAEKRLGAVEPVGPGIWRCRVLQRLLFLVSGGDLPIEADTLPFHILEPGSSTNEGALARLLVNQPKLLPALGEWVINLHPGLVKEFVTMIKSKKINLRIKPLVEILGLDEVLRQLREEHGLNEEEWAKFIMRTMSPAKRKALIKRLIEHQES